MRRCVILGSSGSIGTQALDVIRRHRDMFDVVGLAVGRNVEILYEQAYEFGPAFVAASDTVDRDRLPPGTEVIDGRDRLRRLCADVDADVILNGVVGAAGLEATVATLLAGRTLALANKESLVAGGPVVLAARAAGGGQIVPVDSEHAAAAQILRGERPEEISRLVLTASGGPFRGYTKTELAAVTVEQALKHPTWNMGAVITINSATLMNKGLELIEASLLFDLTPDQLGAVVHPQSIVHAIVELVDGSSKAQIGLPDMRQPIGWALSHPDRLDDAIGAVDWAALPPLTFEPPDLEVFRCLAIALDVIAEGGTAPAVMNAANEIAVEAFLEGRCRFVDIPAVVAAVLDVHDVFEPSEVDEIVEVDSWARDRALVELATVTA